MGLNHKFPRTYAKQIADATLYHVKLKTVGANGPSGSSVDALRVRELLYLGRPQDRTRLTTCSTWGDPKTAVAPLLGETPRPH